MFCRVSLTVCVYLKIYRVRVLFAHKTWGGGKAAAAAHNPSLM